MFVFESNGRRTTKAVVSEWDVLSHIPDDGKEEKIVTIISRVKHNFSADVSESSGLRECSKSLQRLRRLRYDSGLSY